MVYGIYRPWMRRSNTTIINNSYMNMPNGCGYGTGGCCGGGAPIGYGSKCNSGMEIMLAILGLSTLGGLFSGIGGNRQAKIEQQNQQTLLAEQDAKNNTAETLQQLKDIYGNEWNVMEQDGEFILQNKEDKKNIICGTTLKDIVNKIAQDSKPTKTEIDEENKELDELKEIVKEQGETIKTLEEQLEAKENGDTPPDNVNNNPNSNGEWKKVTGDTKLPGEYKWGSMGATGDDYEGKTAEEIATAILGDGASEKDIANMAEKIKNKNPNAFGSDGKVTNPSRLNVPVKKTTANNTTSDKTAKIDAAVTFSIQPLKGNKNTASVTIDGKTYTATIKAIDWKGGKTINYVDDFLKAVVKFDDRYITKAIRDDLIEQLKKQIEADGYTNVNLYNNNPDVEVLNFGTPPEDA